MKLKVNHNWIHIIGISGVTTAPLATTLQDKGFYITGSDRNLYDPIKSYLEKQGIKVNLNFSFQNLLLGNEMPGLIIVGSGISLTNKEYLFAKKQNLNIKHFPELLQELIIDKNSLVITGSYAKTTITSMLVDIFKSSQVEISYMFGGLPINEEPSIKLKNNKTKLSIVEGDEYISSRWDQKSKFFYYNPLYLVITGVQWDHADIFKNEKEYSDNFKKLVERLPDDGIVFANLDDINVKQILKDNRTQVIDISYAKLASWASTNNITVNLIGELNLQNAVISAKIAAELGLSMETIKRALKQYKGIKRRLEIRNEIISNDSHIVVIDDFASSPAKVASSLKSIRDHFKEHFLVTVFEPNFGNRTKESLNQYEEVFSDTSILLLPKFLQVKSTKYPISENDFKNLLKTSKIEVKVFKSIKELGDIVKLLKKRNSKIAIAFLSSHGMEERIRYVNQMLHEQEKA